MILKQDVPYEEPTATPENARAWQDQVIEAFRRGDLKWMLTGVDDKYLLVGECPRCNHDMDQVHRLEAVIFNFDTPQAEESTPIPYTIRMAIECNCQPFMGPHAKGETGCGYASRIEVAVPNPALTAMPPDVQAIGASHKSDRDYWNEQATKLNRTQLELVQTSATKWAALTSTLLGLFGTVAFATGLGAIEDLPDSWPLIVRIATTVAFLLILYGTWKLARAAGGLRRVDLPEGFGGLELEKQSKIRSESAQEELTTGRYAAIAGTLIAIVGALTIFWLDKPAANPPTLVAVTNSGQIVCGKLAGPANAPTITGNTAPVSSINVVAKCPET